MGSTSKRTRLRAVYVTDTERDLIVSALGVLFNQLLPNNNRDATTEVSKFARTYTGRRIAECIALFKDHPEHAIVRAAAEIGKGMEA